MSIQNQDAFILSVTLFKQMFIVAKLFILCDKFPELEKILYAVL